MKWENLLTTMRTGQSVEKIVHDRSEFQRDYDRVIFSPPFRRLQNKTQVFPLPGSIFVHNRLTHSLEVASVGRSLGNKVARFLAENGLVSGGYAEETGSIVSAACLAHDMGNPPFGHSGERAISHFFTVGRGKDLLAESDMTDAQKSDLTNFDGNANTFRLLTHSFNGRRTGGFALTFPTVASIVKYPRPSVGVNKFGYFQQDKPTFDMITELLGMPCLDAEHGRFARYPFVYLVEAADDICYELMDVEDAFRLGILTYDETCSLLCAFFDREQDKHFYENKDKVFKMVTDQHEQVAYLRSICIGRLVDHCARIFCQNVDSILAGEFEKSLVDHLPENEKNAMKAVARLAIDNIYRHKSVIEIELSGFKILGTLLDAYSEALMNPKQYYSQLMLPYIPEQYRVSDNASTYEKMLAAVDTVSGMTDVYALDLFKKIKGIGLG